MGKQKVNITTENISEWMHSVGYFFPTSNKEIVRFEKLHSEIEVSQEEIDQIDPVAIINGKWRPSAKVINIGDNNLEKDISELRMAARKQKGLPDHILKRIQKNQGKDNNDNQSED